MISSLESTLRSYMTSCSIFPYSDFSSVDTLSKKQDYLGFYSIKNADYSDKVYSFDNTSYAVELSSRAEIKLFGKRNGFKDYSLFNSIIDSLIKLLLTSDEFLITDLKLSQINMNAALGRLEINISFNIKVLMETLIEEV